MLHLKARHERVEVDIGICVVEARHALAHLDHDELAYQVVAADHGIEVCLRCLIGHTMGDELGNARCGLVGRRLVDAALGTFGGVELNCVETAQAYASAIREHALGGILEEILALDALDYRLVVCTFKPQTADDTHFCQEELLSSEHPPPDFLRG